MIKHRYGDPSVACVVVPVYTIEFGNNVWLLLSRLFLRGLFLRGLFLRRTTFHLDRASMTAPSEEDETALAISAQLAEVDIDGLGCRPLELPIERHPIGIVLVVLVVLVVVHDGLLTGVYDKFLPIL